MKSLKMNRSPCEFCQEFSTQNGEFQGQSILKGFFDENRIIFLDGAWNLIPTLGSFVTGYTLLVNSIHRPSLYHCSEKEKEAFLHFMQLLKRGYDLAYGTDFFMFEHGVVDETVEAPNSVNHVHLHFLPYRKEYSIVEDILSEKYQFQEYVFSDIMDLNEMIDKQNIKAYLLYYVFGKFHMVDISVNKLPSQFLRKVIYGIEYSTEDDGWNWRDHFYMENMLITYKTMKETFESFSQKHDIEDLQ